MPTVTKITGATDISLFNKKKLIKKIVDSQLFVRVLFNAKIFFAWLAREGSNVHMGLRSTIL